MNVLMVGSGKGSWEIRGIQLGAAIGARVVNVPSADDWTWADVVVLVKRAAFMFAGQARRAGVPIVWDALDFWQQPADNPKIEADAIRLLGAAQATIQPALTIGATEAMAKAANGVYLPHHSWPGLVPTPARPRVEVVAYQGNPQYLGAWRVLLEAACRRRGWSFVVNPERLDDADIIVAFRDGVWDGWMCRQWKSGVKLVNAIAAWRPIITQPTAAAIETATADSLIDRPDELDTALDAVTPYDYRSAIVPVSMVHAASYDISAIAERYVAILSSVRDRCAA